MQPDIKEKVFLDTFIELPFWHKFFENMNIKCSIASNYYLLYGDKIFKLLKAR